MFRLSVLLIAGLFVTLLIAGEDRGQMRPGLAMALAEGEKIVVLERRRAAPVAPAPAGAEPEPTIVAASYSPEAAPAPPLPEPTARKVTPAPVFTLSTLPSLDGDKVAVAADLPAAPTAAPSPAGGEVWYVTASSVNVRETPSTEAYVLGKLAAGEAVTVVALAGGEWAQIIIEGDGVEGYVATRFLSPEAP